MVIIGVFQTSDGNSIFPTRSFFQKNYIMVTQLNPTIPLITPKGKGFAHLVIDYSQEHDLMWVVFLDKNGECWTFGNKEVKIIDNLTAGRTYYSDNI